MGHPSNEPKYACAQHNRTLHPATAPGMKHEWARKAAHAKIAGPLPAVEGALVGGAGLVGTTTACVRWRMCGVEAGIGEGESASSARAASHSQPAHRGLRGELRGGRGENVYVNARVDDGADGGGERSGSFHPAVVGAMHPGRRTSLTRCPGLEAMTSKGLLLVGYG